MAGPLPYSFGEPTSAPDIRDLNVVVIYEDVASARRAMAVLNDSAEEEQTSSSLQTRGGVASELQIPTLAHTLGDFKGYPHWGINE